MRRFILAYRFHRRPISNQRTGLTLDPLPRWTAFVLALRYSNWMPHP